MHPTSVVSFGPFAGAPQRQAILTNDQQHSAPIPYSEQLLHPPTLTELGISIVLPQKKKPRGPVLELLPDDEEDTTGIAVEAGADASRANEELERARKVVWTLSMRTAGLGCGFALIFTAFNVAQSYLTTLFPTVGLYAMSANYICFAFGSLVAPRVADRVGIKWSMVAGSATIATFVAALGSGMAGLLLVASAFVGFGMGCLWISQGVWMSRLSKKAGGHLTGYFTGLFFSIANVNGILGNAIALFILLRNGSTSTVITLMTLIAIAGSLILSFANPMHVHEPVNMHTIHPSDDIDDDETDVEDDDIVEVDSKPLRLADELRAMIGVTLRPETLVLIPYIVHQGSAGAFAFGTVPSLLEGEGTERSARLSMVFLCYGTANCLFSLAIGRISDIYGTTPLLLTTLTTLLLEHALLLLTVTLSLPPLIPLLLAGALGGLLDCTATNMINYALSSSYAPGRDTAAAFGVYRCLYAAAVAGSSVLAGSVGYGGVSGWTVTWGCVACGVYALGGEWVERASASGGESGRKTGAEGRRSEDRERQEPLLGSRLWEVESEEEEDLIALDSQAW
ncbi:hypothetical protein HK104_003576 [Borealophlyctis nickersoniae]|nr:hypothetical protein HK104_003576 [Borealophlyctis nickersoniae]